jgi:deazaflavin-dependent oxidoreductase (nitroreductase family)
MRAPRRGPLIEFAWKAHKLVWRISGGRIGTKAVGLPVLELTTTGRRSGEARSVLLSYLDLDGGFAVIASNAGDDRPPAWWLNLQTDPRARVTAARRSHDVVARRAEGSEREVLWERAVAANPGFADYATYTERPIPVVVLEMDAANPGFGV